MENNRKADVGVIGGTGVYGLEELELIETVHIKTPWGYPSDEINICRYTDSGKELKIAFLPRHGRGHFIPPSKIPQKANMAAMKILGVDEIVAFSAVGSLRTQIEPGHFVLPDQIIDRTRQRDATYFNESIVAHVSFGDPFSKEHADLLNEAGNNLGLTMHKDKTLICMEGPQFSTRAESKLYRSWGADIINMSVLPEAKLARELEICYQMVCMSTDYDSWREEDTAVDTDNIMKVVKKNSSNAQELLRAMLPLWLKKYPISSNIKSSMQFSIITSKEKRNEQEVEKLKIILPKYF